MFFLTLVFRPIPAFMPFVASQGGALTQKGRLVGDKALDQADSLLFHEKHAVRR
jgi:hypothetical protein